VTYSCLWLILRVFATIRSNFNYFGCCYNFVAIIDNFILWAGWFYVYFHPWIGLYVSCNNHQVSRVELEIFYGDLGVFFYVYIKIVFKIYYPYDKYVFFKY
jgi:hypothetical protein